MDPQTDKPYYCSEGDEPQCWSANRPKLTYNPMPSKRLSELLKASHIKELLDEAESEPAHGAKKPNADEQEGDLAGDKDYEHGPPDRA